MRTTVLIVDDQPELLAGVVALLADEGFDAHVHESVITLPLVVRQLDPDVILLDLSMPALSGSAVFRVGRARLRTDAPLVLFSGRDDAELARTAEEVGADGFLSKTRTPIEVIAHIRSWSDHRRALRDARREEGRDDESRTASAAAY